MALNAILTFGKLQVATIGSKFGYRGMIEHPKLRQSVSELETYSLIVGQNAAFFNTGMMSQMQSNPDSTTTQCYADTVDTNEEIINMSDISAYITDGGEYDQAAFLNLAKIMQIKWIAQLESCDYLQFLIALDGMFSNVPQAAAAGVNLVTQIGTGFENSDTSIYIAVNKIEEGIADDNNWETFGKGFQLGLSQLLKISAGDTSIEVTPTNV